MREEGTWSRQLNLGFMPRNSNSVREDALETS